MVALGKVRKPIKFRSKFEAKVAEKLTETIVNSFEKFTIGYTLKCNYTPDFELGNGWFLEVKGEFDSHDRRKHVALREQHGKKINILFCFQNYKAKIEKGSKTTLSQWCDKHEFEWCSFDNLHQKIVEVLKK